MCLAYTVDVGKARQPARATALGIAGQPAGAVKSCIRALLRRQGLYQMEDVQHERRLMVAQLPIPLLPRGQL